MSNTTSSNGGVGLCGLLTVLFIGLKLTGNITWPWLWVLSPLWIPLGTALALLLIAGLLYFVAALSSSKKKRGR